MYVGRRRGAVVAAAGRNYKGRRTSLAGGGPGRDVVASEALSGPDC